MSGLLIDIETILPFGPSLLPLINSSFLSNANLFQLLKFRGIYHSSSDKDTAVSNLKNIILSPYEFNSLREQQKTKEDRRKNIGEDIVFKSSESLLDITSDDHFSVNDVLERQQGAIRIEGVSSINIIDNDHLYYEYNLIRNDISKDWANSESRHAGRVDIIKKKNVISIKSEYTSNETRKVNDEIAKRIKGNLRKKTKNGNLETYKITFDAFSNISRINFLFSFLESKRKFGLYKILDITFGPDPAKILPDQAKWMEKKVKNISIFGEDLEKIEYFANKKYHESLLIENIDAQFIFTIDSSKYIARISYGFPSYFKTEIPNTEFEYSIRDITDSELNKKYSNALQRVIEETFSDFKTKMYYKFTNPKSSGKKVASKRHA
jgi:hypothetical protein